MLKGQKLQDTYLDALCRQQVPVSMFLVNGVKLEGQVASFDQYSILLKGHVTQMIYKHAISTINPLRDFKLPPELGPESEIESQPKKAQPDPLPPSRRTRKSS